MSSTEPSAKTTSIRRKRVVRDSETWRQYIKQHQDSGLSQVDFCKNHHLPISTFTKWKKKLANHPSTTPSTEFVPVTLKSIPSVFNLEIVFQGDVMLRIPSDSDPATVRPWISLLRQRHD